MKIAGFVKQSFVDYPGKIAAAVFTQGCNMNCTFCHNRCLVGEKTDDPTVAPEEVFSFLQNRKKFLDGVVVSGGEPTLQPDLEAFVGRIKGMGYLVKLDTNGTKPQVIKKLIDKKLVDYIAMDVKAPMTKYHDICRSSISEETLLESISMIRQSNVDYEFRTTYCPELNEDDIREIGELLRGARKYVLQQYRETDPVKGGYSGKATVVQFHEEPNREIKNYVSRFQIRGEIQMQGVSL